MPPKTHLTTRHRQVLCDGTPPWSQDTAYSQFENFAIRSSVFAERKKAKHFNATEHFYN